MDVQLCADRSAGRLAAWGCIRALRLCAAAVHRPGPWHLAHRRRRRRLLRHVNGLPACLVQQCAKLCASLCTKDTVAFLETACAAKAGSQAAAHALRQTRGLGPARESAPVCPQRGACQPAPSREQPAGRRRGRPGTRGGRRARARRPRRARGPRRGPGDREEEDEGGAGCGDGLVLLEVCAQPHTAAPQRRTLSRCRPSAGYRAARLRAKATTDERVAAGSGAAQRAAAPGVQCLCSGMRMTAWRC